MDYQEKRLKRFRNRIVFNVLGFTFTNNTLTWTGVLFNVVVIKEEKIKYRYKDFEEFNYSFFWSPWRFKYEFIKII